MDREERKIAQDGVRALGAQVSTLQGLKAVLERVRQVLIVLAIAAGIFGIAAIVLVILVLGTWGPV